jgi:SAM-dependent methyltransferase
MGLIPGYRLLKRFYPGGAGVPCGSADPYTARGEDKLEVLLWPTVYEELVGRKVLDFGCGEGVEAVKMARRGVNVTGFDLSAHNTALARQRIANAGLPIDITMTAPETKYDVIISLDGFEHYADPLAVLRQMDALLTPAGQVFVSFGYMWGHPLGGHLFSPFPWAHRILRENSLLRWRADFKEGDRASFEECGLNRITLRKWERAVEESPLEFVQYEIRPIRKTHSLHNRFTREWLTSNIAARLAHRRPSSGDSNVSTRIACV